MCEEEEGEMGRRWGFVWGGIGGKGENERGCVRRKRWKGGEGWGLFEEEEGERGRRRGNVWGGRGGNRGMLEGRGREGGSWERGKVRVREGDP
jgi:hypothetical protein